MSRFCYLFLPMANAFVQPLSTPVSSLLLHRHHSLSPTALNLQQSFVHAPTLTLADGLSAATRLNEAGMLEPLQQLRSFFIVITAIVFGLTAIAYLTAAIIVPQGKRCH